MCVYRGYFLAREAAGPVGGGQCWVFRQETCRKSSCVLQAPCGRWAGPDPSTRERSGETAPSLPVVTRCDHGGASALSKPGFPPL